MKLADRVAIVTGAAQGIGAAQLPQHLEQQGLHPGAQAPIHRRKGRRARLAAADGLQGVCSRARRA